MGKYLRKSLVKIKQILLYFFTIILLILLIIYIRDNNKLKNNLTNLENKRLHLSYLIEEINKVKLAEIDILGTPIQNIALMDTSGNTTTLSEQLYNKSLVFRFNENSCLPCIEDLLSSNNNLNESQILSVGSFYNLGSFKFFVKSNSISNCFMVINEEVRITELDNTHNVYFFTIDNQQNIINTHIPLTISPEITQKYIKSYITQ